MQNYNLPWDILIGYQKCIRLQIMGDTDSRVNNPAQIKGHTHVYLPQITSNRRYFFTWPPTPDNIQSYFDFNIYHTKYVL
jgi:hypothetical protein